MKGGIVMYEKIMIPLDGSDLAAKAIDEAEKLASFFHSELVLFEVIHLSSVCGSADFVMPLIADDEQKESAEKYLAGVAEGLRKKGFKVTTAVKVGQQVAVEIIEFAKENHVSLIVMCTHGRSGITRWVLGSIAHKVLTRAETPILLLRPKR
jgi:nucleotide-binding universal stress UspA family protein